MKVLIFSDVHWSTSSSIVRTVGKNYSTRLEHLIDGMNWVNETAIKNNCGMMICAGDFFDKPNCSDEEITALREIKWNNLPCYFLCGNHESSVSDLRYNALKILESENHIIVSDQFKSITLKNTQIHFIPYIVEANRQPLDEYLNKGVYIINKHIIISHNDIAGIQYGGFESKTGFSIKEIEENCDLYLNGHLHNSEWVSRKILNVGSFSGHNFTNDSINYKYGVWILDTETLQVEFIENPFGFNFYKLELNTEQDLKQLETLKQNAVVSIKCSASIFSKCQELINSLENIIEKRITVTRDLTEIDSAVSIEDLQGTDHLAKLVEFCKLNINNDDILNEELMELCK